MPAAFEFAEVLGIHARDPMSYLFQGFTAFLSSSPDRLPERLGRGRPGRAVELRLDDLQPAAGATVALSSASSEQGA